MSEKVRYVHITIHDVPAELIVEFSEKVVVPDYPGGISQAIKDLMRKAVKEQRDRERKE